MLERRNIFGALWTSSGESILYSGNPNEDDPYVKGSKWNLDVSRQGWLWIACWHDNESSKQD